MAEERNLHSGHRQRLKEQFRDHGLEGFTDVQALELLLFYAIGQRDTNALAHRLLDRFGSFRAVMEAGAGELEEVEGVGPSAAQLIELVTALNRRYLAARRKLGETLDSVHRMCEYVEDLFRYKTTEEVYCLCLNGAAQVLSIHKLGVGSSATVVLPTQEIARIALRDRAAGVIITHNHLTDIAVASNADIAATLLLRDALHTLGITLLDHIIVSDNDAVSMRDSGIIK